MAKKGGRLFYDGDLLPYVVGALGQSTFFVLEDEHGSFFSEEDENGETIDKVFSSVKELKEFLEEEGYEFKAHRRNEDDKKRNIMRYTLTKDDNTVDLERIETIKRTQNDAFLRHAVKSMIKRAMRLSGCDDIRVFQSGEGNYREAVARIKKYKGSRDGKVKPLAHKMLARYINKTYNAQIVDNMEADDALGIMQSRYAAKRKRAVICTGDKDLLQVPGEKLMLRKEYKDEKWRLYYEALDVDEFGTLKYDQEKDKISGTGLWFFYAQMLMGDTVDDIPGCPGVGKKGTWEALMNAENEQDLKDAVFELYRMKYDPTGDGFGEISADHWSGITFTTTVIDLISEQGKLLWMMRETPEEDYSNLWEFEYEPK